MIRGPPRHRGSVVRLKAPTPERRTRGQGLDLYRHQRCMVADIALGFMPVAPHLLDLELIGYALAFPLAGERRDARQNAGLGQNTTLFIAAQFGEDRSPAGVELCQGDRIRPGFGFLPIRQRTAHIETHTLKPVASLLHFNSTDQSTSVQRFLAFHLTFQVLDLTLDLFDGGFEQGELGRFGMTQSLKGGFYHLEFGLQLAAGILKHRDRILLFEFIPQQGAFGDHQFGLKIRDGGHYGRGIENHDRIASLNPAAVHGQPTDRTIHAVGQHGFALGGVVQHLAREGYFQRQRDSGHGPGVLGHKRQGY